MLLTHFNLVTQLQQLSAEHVKFTKDDTLVGVLPFFNIYGMVINQRAKLETKTFNLLVRQQ